METGEEGNERGHRGLFEKEPSTGWKRDGKDGQRKSVTGKNRGMHESSCSRLNGMEAYEKRISPFDLEWDDTSQLPFPYMLQTMSPPPPNTHTHTQSSSVWDVRPGQRRKKWCYCFPDRRGQGVSLAIFIELNTSCWQFSRCAVRQIISPS